MDVTFEIFNGFSIGIEYAGKQETEMDESVIIVEVACIRMMIWLGDYDT